MIHSSPTRRSLTLVELVVVLALLVLVSTLALQSTDRIVSQGRYDATVLQLEAIQDATIGSHRELDSAGERLLSGFAVDLGRFPVLGAPGSELQELWDRGSLEPYGTHSATQDPQVSLSYGWRGPYLSSPIGGPPQVLDGWQEPFKFFDDAAGTMLTSAGDPIDHMFSYGADKKIGGSGAFDVDLDVSLQEKSNSPQTFNITVEVTVTNAPLAGEEIVVALYEADNATSPRFTRDFLATTITAAGATSEVEFLNVLPGHKVVRAYQASYTRPTLPDSFVSPPDPTPSAVSPPKRITVYRHDTFYLTIP